MLVGGLISFLSVTSSEKSGLQYSMIQTEDPDQVAPSDLVLLCLQKHEKVYTYVYQAKGYTRAVTLTGEVEGNLPAVAACLQPSWRSVHNAAIVHVRLGEGVQGSAGAGHML